MENAGIPNMSSIKISFFKINHKNINQLPNIGLERILKGWDAWRHMSEMLDKWLNIQVNNFLI